jgi:23S rRNA (uracil1939-C5)-methyltransferase
VYASLFSFFFSSVDLIMQTSKPKRVVELALEYLSMRRGNGVGKFSMQKDQFAWAEVPFTLPSEKVKATLLRKRGGIYSARLEEVISPSPDRITPKCVHFGVCGGCRWQHMPYSLQLLQKDHFIRHSFAPLLTAQMGVQPIIPCDLPWNYRNKMEFTFSQNRAKERFLGLVMDASKGKVFHLQECHLVQPWIVEGLKAVRSWWRETDLDAYKPLHNQGSLRNVTFREGVRTGDRMVILMVSGNPDYALTKQHLETFKAFVRAAVEPLQGDAQLSIFLRIQQIAKGMPTQFYEMWLHGADHIRETLQITYSSIKSPLSLNFHISPTAFFQPNTRQAEQLYSTALQLAQIPEGSVVYDLYCGTGTLGICAAQEAKQVVGIELSPESSLDARTNVQLNGLNNVVILTGAVAQILQQIRADNSYPMPDVVMVDPPRVGLEASGIKQLVALMPAKILYISCNPLTQMADVQQLVESGYHMTHMRAVDQFPQTAHIENIVVLQRAV